MFRNRGRDKGQTPKPLNAWTLVQKLGKEMPEVIKADYGVDISEEAARSAGKTYQQHISDFYKQLEDKETFVAKYSPILAAKYSPILAALPRPPRLPQPSYKKASEPLKVDFSDLPLEELAPAIIYQPGSRWVKKSQITEFSPRTTGEIFDTVMMDIASPHRKLKNEEWKVICSQLGEYRKDELLDIVNDLDLRDHIRGKMTKQQICDFLTKFLRVLESSK